MSETNAPTQHDLTVGGSVAPAGGVEANATPKPTKTFTTKIRAIDPLDGELKTWVGPHIDAADWDEAIDICKGTFGYCMVDGELMEG